MSYATLEEVWGPEFTKKRKSKKERKLERQEKQMLKESVDPSIVIPKLSDDRKQFKVEKPKYDEYLDSFNINGYDTYSKGYSNYQNQSQVGVQPQVALQPQVAIQPTPQVKPPEQVVSDTNSLDGSLNQLVSMSRGEYNKLVEGFSNTTDSQFNQLLLYVFTGIFYLMTLDMMYQLGKKSY